MSKILDATCNPAGIVTSESVPVPAATVMSEGKQQSTGIMIMDKDKAWYLTSNATDIKTTIEKVNAALDDLTAALTTISNILTAIGAGMTGPTTAPPPTLVTDVAQITTKVSSISATKALLETLKGALK